MEELPDKSVNLIVTSPPYFNVKNYSKDGRQKEGQIGDINTYRTFIDHLVPIWQECHRVLVHNGKLIINTPLMPMPKSAVSTHHNRHIYNINSDIEHSILSTISDIYLMDVYIWDRANPTKNLMFGSYPYPSNFYAQNSCEFITVYVKGGKPAKVAQDIKDKSSLSPEEWQEYTKQIWTLNIPSSSDFAFGEHPAIMPEEIVRRLVKLYSFWGDLVLDPFTGSGTTLQVARELGRRYVGYELCETYKSIISDKIQAGQRPTFDLPMIDSPEAKNKLFKIGEQK